MSKHSQALECNKQHPVKGGRVNFISLTKNNLGSFRLLNSKILPVEYSNKFYENVLNTEERYTKMAYFNDVLVGAIACRIEKAEKTDKFFKLYIMTLSILEPYRRRGIGAVLLRNVTEQAVLAKDISQIYFNVQISNTSAIAFYESEGFKIIETKKDYYQNIEPRDAFVLSKTLIEGVDV